jgi:hypothetical protein
VTGTSNIGQSEISAAANATYFLEHLQDYHDSIATIDTYRTLHDFISKQVEGVNELLDVGNGGVFAYDTSRVGSITAIDLFSRGPASRHRRDVFSEKWPCAAGQRFGHTRERRHIRYGPDGDAPPPLDRRGLAIELAEYLPRRCRKVAACSSRADGCWWSNPA